MREFLMSNRWSERKNVNDPCFSVRARSVCRTRHTATGASRPRRVLHTLLIAVTAIVVPIAGSSQEPSDAPPPPAASRSEVTLESLAAKAKQIENATDLSPEERTALLEKYNRARAHVEAAKVQAARATDLRRQLDAGPGQIEALGKDVATAPPDPEEQLEAELGNSESGTLETRLAAAEAAFAAAGSEERHLDDELNQEETRRAAWPPLLKEAETAAEALAGEAPIAQDGQSAAQIEAEQTLREARHRDVLTRLEALEQEGLSHDTRTKILRLQQQQAARRLAHSDKERKWLQDTLNKRRIAEATEERERTEETANQVRSRPPAIKDLADANLKLAEAIEKTGIELERTSGESETLGEWATLLENRFEGARQRLDAVGRSSLVGRLLREERRSLLQQSDYEKRLATRGVAIEEYTLARIDVEEQLRDLTDVATEARTRAREASQADTSPEDLERDLRELLEAQKALLKKLARNYNELGTKLQKNDTTHRELVEESVQFATFLDEHLIWIRSAPLVGLETLKEASTATLRLLQPREWFGFFEALKRALQARPLQSGCLVLLAIVLLCVVPRLRGRLETIRSRVGRVRSDSFELTVEALLITAIRVLPVPLVLGGCAWMMLEHEPPVEPFPRAVATSGWTLAVLLFALRFLHRLLVKDGIAQTHFRWRAGALATLQRPESWWLTSLVLVPASMLVALNEVLDETAHNSLGRLAFLVLMLGLAQVTRRLFRPTDGLFRDYLEREPDGWFSRLRYAWYPALVALPLILAALGAVGYYYTALELGGVRLYYTVLALLGAVLVQNLIHRWVFLEHRRLAVEKVLAERRARQAEREETTESAPSGETPIEITEPEVNLEQVNAQARSLLGSLVFTGVLLTLWWIWSGVFPALNILNGAQLWPYQAFEGDVEVQKWVTLQSLAVAVIVLILTALASRNISGALELFVLPKLPIDAGTRYAITTLCQYFLIVVGLLLAASAIGIGWSQVQWLAAAISVGLGFGLQEIFANLVSGLILLFERPMRVGDIVTVGDVTGVVSKIRMRATTVTNWDRKELIVPNKEFITGRLLNWTLSDSINRVVIRVGVAYGSDTEKARELLLAAARKHPLILDEPPPGAIFDGFGDSSLDLVLRCFLPDLNNRLSVVHELHTQINGAFAEAGLEIPFPQRDVNLRTSTDSAT